jgi:hypothetical protein
MPPRPSTISSPVPVTLAGEAHAAGAHDAAVGIEQDVRAEVLLRLLDLLLLEARLAAAVLVRVILEQHSPAWSHTGQSSG